MTKLKQLREASGMSQSQLSRATGINYRTLQCYEQGMKAIDSAKLETLLKLCVALKCRIPDIIESADLIALYEKYAGD